LSLIFHIHVSYWYCKTDSLLCYILVFRYIQKVLVWLLIYQRHCWIW
jgi:hypothetical protein